MGACEARLVGSADPDLQLLGLIGSFVRAREAVVKMAH